MFGDPAYSVGPHILSLFSDMTEQAEEKREWNAQMARVCMEVEHGIGIVSNMWPFLNATWKMRLYLSLVGRY